MHILQKILADRDKPGCARGVYSVCSANEFVISAAMEEGVRTGAPVLIEATANQVNQYGGYTGMKPADFKEYAESLARKAGLDGDMLILGGDHLGPLTWQNECEADAMAKSEILIRDFIAAGFVKIHIDTSMRLADDDASARLSDETIAARAARLAAAAENARRSEQDASQAARQPLYIIGSEVPIPGGATGEDGNYNIPGGAAGEDGSCNIPGGAAGVGGESIDHGVRVTSPEQLLSTYRTFRDAFERAGLGGAFSRVLGIVVQPGVEFGDDQIDEYDRGEAKRLIAALPECGGLVFEGHSTDYQTKYKLREMARDGVAILKVGPALTFALREALFALEHIERELLSARSAEYTLSNFAGELDASMMRKPGDWIKHYRGGGPELYFKRRFSLSDRARYYLPDPTVQRAERLLIDNVNSVNIPLSLISQYLPTVYTAIREGRCAPDAESMLKMRVKDCIADYLFAVTC